MPEFDPGSVHRATATFSNPKSAGFDFDASLCMGTDWTEMAIASFHLDAGQSKPVQFSVTMPSAEGAYPIYFKVYSSGMLIGTFIADEDVVIAAVTPPATVLAGVILYSKWRETGTEEWHPWPMSIPGNTGIDVLWRVRNNSNGRATFAVSTGTPERFFTIHSDNVVTLDPGGEADLIHEGYRGEKAGTSGTQTWDLIALAGEVTSSYVLDWLEAVFVDSVTLHYSWY